MGDGQSINFWRHKWVPSLICLQEHALVELSEDDLHARVADFVLEDGSWDWSRLLSMLPANVCELVVGISPPTPLNMLDPLAWFGSHDGLFYVKLAYNYIAFGSCLPTDPLFRLIWRWKDMERVKVFLWQVVTNALLTKFLLFLVMCLMIQFVLDVT